MGCDDLAEDARFTKNSGRVENRDRLTPELQRTFSEEESGYWIPKIRKAGVSCGPVNKLAQVFEDDHVQESGILRDVDHPLAGNIRMLTSPFIIDGERPGIRKPPSTLGQHTDDAVWE